MKKVLGVLNRQLGYGMTFLLCFGVGFLVVQIGIAILPNKTKVVALRDDNTANSNCNSDELAELSDARNSLFEATRIPKESKDWRRIAFMHALSENSKLSYCEDTLADSLQAATALQTIVVNNSERIQIAHHLMHSLENSEMLSNYPSKGGTSALLLVESYARIVKLLSVPNTREDITNYRNLSLDLSQRFEAVGDFRRAEEWRDEYVKYKLFGNIPIQLEKYNQASEKFSKAVDKISDSFK